MIISASRRCDIPAYFSEWMQNRLTEGHVKVKNPFNSKQIRNVSLKAADVDAFVFWTRNPSHFDACMDFLDDNGFSYGFQYSLTGYDRAIELGMPDKNLQIERYLSLAERIGADRIIWRYDPIVMSEKLTDDWHKKNFYYIAKALQNNVKTIVISFVDIYKSVASDMAKLGLNTPTDDEINDIAEFIGRTSNEFGFNVQTCCEKADLLKYGIKEGGCISREWIEGFTHDSIDMIKQKHQRNGCNCVDSVDIGVYGMCPVYCVYCYANRNRSTVNRNFKSHDKDSEFLL